MVGIVIVVSPRAETFNNKSKILPVPLVNGNKTSSIAPFKTNFKGVKAALTAIAPVPVALRLLTAVSRF